MTVQQSKRRPLSRYLKDFKHSQTHCAHCFKLLDRITLVRRGQIVNKIAISRLDTLLDDAEWAQEKKSGWRYAVSAVICIAKSKATSLTSSALNNFCLSKPK
ncbi:flagella biosynthesis protein FliZ [Citrobacter youngae]|nr:flagella biosynthesis protein FliZ [Citrobacter youngae]